ncbi:MAG: heavy-metal-associated domain-containing protein [Phycisphaerales bacterium]|nr:heavy-metal-associated domain-containing protein [Phycisphaerales bacterium]
MPSIRTAVSRTLLLSSLCLGACGETSVAPVAMKISVHGMHCEGCVDAITDKVMKIEGVQSCAVSLEKSEADISAAPSLRPAIETAIKKLGYKLD